MNIKSSSSEEESSEEESSDDDEKTKNEKVNTATSVVLRVLLNKELVN